MTISTKAALGPMILAGTLLLGASAAGAAGTVVLRDDFNGNKLNTTTWGVGTWKLGRTQLGNGVEFEARIRLGALPNGLVAAVFTYNTLNTLSDELDIEILSNEVNASSGGAPVLMTTWNDWNEANPTYGDGIHHASQSVFLSGLNVNAFHTWVIRWLFRHPMHVQKSAEGYLAMLRDQGFEFAANNVSYPYLWWSRSKDFGLLERWGLMKPKPAGQRNETLVNVVARKPLEATPA